MNGKRRGLREAIAENVRDGDAVALGLALESGIPFAAVHEIIRQRKKDLSLIGPISDMAFDHLIGAGTTGRVIAAWVGNVAGGSGYAFRRAVEDGIPRAIEVEDHSNFTVGLALKAAAMGLPYLPTFTGLGGDIVKDHPRVRPVTDPFGGPSLLAVGALRPDVAIVHVQRADEDGNAHLWGNLGLVVEAAYSARRTILTCEEIVPGDVIRSDPNRTQIPGFLVSAVVEEPGAPFPPRFRGTGGGTSRRFSITTAGRRPSGASRPGCRSGCWSCPIEPPTSGVSANRPWRSSESARSAWPRRPTLRREGWIHAPRIDGRRRGARNS